MKILKEIEKIKVNSCGISDCDADWHWDTGENGFQDYDLWVVLRGKGRIITACDTIEVSAGSCLLLFPNMHYIGEQDDDYLLVMNVHFCIPENTFLSVQSGKTHFIHKSILDIEYMRDIISRVILLCNSEKSDAANIVFRSAMVEYLLQHSLYEKAESDQDQPPVIEKMCNRINLTPESPHKLSAYAAEYGYSADYLGRVFAKHIGISFSEYVANARINKAKYLLTSTNDSIERIAEILGYYDNAYFARQFRRITGIAPGRYRKEKQKTILHPPQPNESLQG